MSKWKVRSQRNASTSALGLLGYILITSLFLAGCTRDEVFSAVATAAIEFQATRVASQEVESNPISSTQEPNLALSRAESEDRATQTAAAAAAVADTNAMPIVETATEMPTETATSVATSTPEPPTPTTAPTLTPTPRPSLTPSPTPVPDVLEQGGAELFLVAGGEFEMGMDATLLLAECNIFRTGCQESWFSASGPVHTLSLPGFYIDATEVTNAAYAAFLNELEESETGCLEQRCLNLEDSRLTLNEAGVYEVAEDEADYPITGVSWYGAAAFCAWRGGRLPSEAEWEKAAVWDPEAGTKTIYPWGDVFDGSVVNTCDASCQQPQANQDFDDGFPAEAPVASFEDGRSPSGAYDMGGNVWEWVADWYDSEYYQAENVAPGGPVEGEDKVVRGGSWFDTGNFTAGSLRFPSPPANTDESIGFRCAADE